MPFPARTLGFKTSPQHVDWATLDDTWAAAGELRALIAREVAEPLLETASWAGRAG